MKISEPFGAKHLKWQKAKLLPVKMTVFNTYSYHGNRSIRSEPLRTNWDRFRYLSLRDRRNKTENTVPSLFSYELAYQQKLELVTLVLENEDGALTSDNRRVLHRHRVRCGENISFADRQLQERYVVGSQLTFSGARVLEKGFPTSFCFGYRLGLHDFTHQGTLTLSVSLAKCFAFRYTRCCGSRTPLG